MEQNDPQLEFVLHYYQPDTLDTQQAIRRLHPARPAEQERPARTIPLWRKWAVAASFAGVLIGGAYAAYTYLDAQQPTSTIQHPSPNTPHPSQPVAHFHFDNTPLPQVLDELGRHYGVRLTADQPDKRLTADFDATNLDATIAMIEQVLGVRITQSAP